MIVKIAPVSAIHIQSECILVSALAHLNINTFTDKLLMRHHAFHMLATIVVHVKLMYLL